MIHMRKSRTSVIVSSFLALALFIATATSGNAGQGADYGGSGSVSISFSPVLGLNVGVVIGIDGRYAGVITKGHTFWQELPAGRHVIFVSRNGRLSEGTSTIVDVRPGQTYHFTAHYNTDALVIVPTGARRWASLY